MRILRRVVQRLVYALSRKRGTVLAVLTLALVLSAYLAWQNGAAGQPTAADDGQVEVRVQGFQPRASGAATLTLKEKNGSRRIALDVTGVEALVIAREQGYRTQIEPPRSYDLLRDVIQQMGGRLDRVVIDDASDTQFFAQLVVTSGGEPHLVRARPSDAVALALRSGAPIFVSNRLLNEPARKVSG